MTLERFGRFVSAVTQILKDIQKIEKKQMKRFGLRGAHVMSLLYLYRENDGMTAAELSAQCGVDKGAVSRTVAELCRLGYVSCHEPENKRKYRARIMLTDAGRQVADQIDVMISDGLQKVGRGLSDKQRENLYDSLAIISENVRRLAAE